jgi:hypothetical protein
MIVADGTAAIVGNCYLRVTLATIAFLWRISNTNTVAPINAGECGALTIARARVQQASDRGRGSQRREGRKRRSSFLPEGRDALDNFRS